MSIKFARFEVTEDDLTIAFHQAIDPVFGQPPQGIQIVPFIGAVATKTALQTTFTASGRYLGIACVGHGDDSHFKIYAPVAQIIFSPVTNSPEVAGAIVHLLSCNCGINLGPDFVARQSAKAFIGYNNYFFAPSDLGLVRYFVAPTVAINQAIMAKKTSAAVKAAADTAAQTARLALAADPTCTSFDLVSFDANQDALVGPWTDAKYGTF